MCDIYLTKCDEIGCENLVDVHISDFCAKRESIRARCADHPPTDSISVNYKDEQPINQWVEFRCNMPPDNRTIHCSGHKYKTGTCCYIILDSKIDMSNVPEYKSHFTYGVSDEGGICPNCDAASMDV